MNQASDDESGQMPWNYNLNDDDQTFNLQVKRLHQLTVYCRWLFVAVIWITIGSLSLWGFRYPITLMLEHFTWAALLYGIVFHRLAAIGIATCIGVTTAVLVWQSRNILMGIPSKELHRLEQQVCRIRQQGPSHPLWQWICKP